MQDWRLPISMAAILWTAIPAGAQNRPPVIQHQPVAMAVRGQPLIVRARVIDDRGAVKSVKLFYAASADAAPFEIPMEASGGGVFIAVIPGHLLAGLESLSYYIEAADDQDNAAETPWHTVRVRIPEPPAAPPENEGANASPKWVVPALVAGGAAIVVGGALYAANRGGSDSPPPPDVSGTYAGTLTLITQDPEAPSDVSTRAVSATVAADGAVTSDSFREGQTLTGRVSGSSFTLIADVIEEGVTGRIVYRGAIVENRILGTIEGSRTTAAGAGTYSGSFTLQRP